MDKESADANYTLIAAASYIYYRKPELTPIISDGIFDFICKSLLESGFACSIEDLSFINADDLAAGSLYKYKSDTYPDWLKAHAIKLSSEVKCY